jgi:hypothetical protein
MGRGQGLKPVLSEAGGFPASVRDARFRSASNRFGKRGVLGTYHNVSKKYLRSISWSFSIASTIATTRISSLM